MKIKNVIIGLAIIILTVSAVLYGINLVYDSPNYDDYCVSVDSPLNTEADCLAAGGTWTAYSGEKPVAAEGGWCDAYSTCREEYDAANEKYQRNMFLITLPLGIILIVGGILVFGLEVVGAGLAGGGVVVILRGVLFYWEYGSDLLRFSLSLVGLLAVIWLAYWFNRRRN